MTVWNLLFHSINLRKQELQDSMKFIEFYQPEKDETFPTTALFSLLMSLTMFETSNLFPVLFLDNIFGGIAPVHWFIIT